MQYFMDTAGTIPDGMGFSQFDALHLGWIGAAVLVWLTVSLLYRRLGEQGRRRMRRAVAALIVADELYKMLFLAIGGRYTVNYLPLHLCSINIILIAIHALRPSKTLDNFLYTVCIPAAIAALLAPTWTELPLANFMHIHSFTVHMLLALYPIMLTAGGDIRPDLRELGKSLLLLIALALPVLGINLLLDTNYMFLIEAEKGNPLYWFETNWGSHLYGFPVLIAGVIAVMYLPMVIRAMRKKKAK